MVASTGKEIKPRNPRKRKVNKDKTLAIFPVKKSFQCSVCMDETLRCNDLRCIYVCIEVMVGYQFVKGEKVVDDQVGIVKMLYIKACKQDTDRDFTGH